MLLRAWVGEPAACKQASEQHDAALYAPSIMLPRTHHLDAHSQCDAPAERNAARLQRE